MDYGYKDSLKYNQERGARKLRLVLIFTVVAAVTAFVIWKLIPAQDAPEKKSPAGTTAPAAADKPQRELPVPELQNDQKRSSSSVVQPGKDGAKTLKDKPAVSSEENTGGEGALTEEVPPAKEITPREPDVQEIFAKGKVSPGDLPESSDKPQIPGEDEQAGKKVRKTLQHLETLFLQKKFAEVSSGAEQLLSTLTAGSLSHRQTLEILSKANWERFLSEESSGSFSLHHTVLPGEYLGRLARKYKTTVQAAVLANKLKGTQIRIGQKLRFLPGPWKISVSKKYRQLLLYRNGRLFMGFDVGIGRQNRTPAADFVISTRLKHPEYRTPDGRIFKHGEPGNELGDYFLKLAPSGKPGRPLAGYGIHGTSDESSVTRSLSNGCIRMRNADVKQLYYIVPAGTPVEIRE